MPKMVPVVWEDDAQVAPAGTMAPVVWDDDEQQPMRQPSAPAQVPATWADNPVERWFRETGTGPNANPVVADLASGVYSGVNDLASMATRIPGVVGDADVMNRMNDQYAQQAEAAHPGMLNRAARGAVRSLTTAVPLAATGAGAYGLPVAFGLSEANQAITEGRDAGMRGAKLAGYAALEGVTEAAPALFMSAVGRSGFEGMIGNLFRRGGEKELGRGLTGLLKATGINFAYELPEEVVTELGHNVNKAMVGVSPEALQGPQLLQTVMDTTLQTAMMMGITGAASAPRAAVEGRIDTLVDRAAAAPPRDWAEEMRKNFGATIEDNVTETIGGREITGRKITTQDKKRWIMISNDAALRRVETPEEQRNYLASLASEETQAPDIRKSAMDALASNDPGAISAVAGALQEAAPVTGKMVATFMDGTQGDAMALIGLVDPNGDPLNAEHELFHTSLKFFLTNREYDRMTKPYLNEAGKLDAKGEERMRMDYQNIRARQRAVEEYGTAPERLMAKFIQRVKSFTGSLFGKDFETLSAELGSGQAWRRGVVTDAAEQNRRGAVTDPNWRAPEVQNEIPTQQNMAVPVPPVEQGPAGGPEGPGGGTAAAANVKPKRPWSKDEDWDTYYQGLTDRELRMEGYELGIHLRDDDRAALIKAINRVRAIGLMTDEDAAALVEKRWGKELAKKFIGQFPKGHGLDFGRAGWFPMEVEGWVSNGGNIRSKKSVAGAKELVAEAEALGVANPWSMNKTALADAIRAKQEAAPAEQKGVTPEVTQNPAAAPTAPQEANAQVPTVRDSRIVQKPADSAKSIEELDAEYEAIQLKIDAAIDEEIARGLSEDQANDTPRVNDLYERRFGIERKIMESQIGSIKKSLANIGETDGTFVDSILKNVYSINPKSPVATYMAFEHGSDALENTDNNTVKEIVRELIQRDVGKHVDVDGYLSIKGPLTQQGRSAVLKSALERAQQIHDAIVRAVQPEASVPTPPAEPPSPAPAPTPARTEIAPQGATAAAEGGIKPDMSRKADEFKSRWDAMTIDERSKADFSDVDPNVFLEMAERGDIKVQHRKIANEYGAKIPSGTVRGDRVSVPKLSKKTPLESVAPIASTDESRQKIFGVYHDAENNFLVATNGGMLVAVPSKVSGKSRLVTVRDTRDAKKGRETESTVLSEWKRTIGKPEDFKTSFNLDIDAVRKKLRVGERLNSVYQRRNAALVIVETPKGQAAFNPKMMRSLLESMVQSGAKTITARVKDHNAPMRFDGDNGSVGAIMRIQLKDPHDGAAIYLREEDASGAGSESRFSTASANRKTADLFEPEQGARFSVKSSRLRDFSEKHGFDVDRIVTAGTGTEYMYLSKDGEEVVVRIGDHAEAYPPSRGERKISVSPQELSLRDGMKLLRDFASGNTEAIPQYLPRMSEEELKEKERNKKEKLERREAYVKIGNAVPQDVISSMEGVPYSEFKRIAAEYGIEEDSTEGFALWKKANPKKSANVPNWVAEERYFKYRTKGNSDKPEQGARFSVANPDDYRMGHRPRPDGPRANDLLETDLAPRDIYEHPEWYTGNPGSRAARESALALRRMRGKPDADVTIYRASPTAELNPGDWVTLSKTYAAQHGMADDPGADVPVHAHKVKASDLRWAGDALEEFGYFPETDPGSRYSTAPPPGSNIPQTTWTRYRIAAFTAAMVHKQDRAAYRKAMLDQHGQAVEPYLDEFADDYDRAYADATRRAQAAVAAQKPISPPRPDLSNIGTTPEAKEGMDRVDQERGNPVHFTQDELEQQGIEWLNSVGDDVAEAELFARVENGEMLDAAMEYAARHLYNRLMLSGDVDKAVAFGYNVWRESGSMWADAGNARQVPKTPAGRAHWLLKHLYAPGRAMERRIEAARSIMRNKEKTGAQKAAARRTLAKLLERQGKQVTKRLAWMRKRGWDLSESGLMTIGQDDALKNRFMRDVSTDRATILDKIHEYRIAAMLSKFTTHEINVASSAGHFGWEVAVQRPVEAFINLFYGDPNAAQAGEFKYMLKAALSVGSLKHAARNAIQAARFETQTLNRQVFGETRFGSGWVDSSHGPAIKGAKGRIIRSPLTLLLVEDEFQRTYMARVEAAAHAFRIAKSEKLRGQALQGRMKELLDDMTSDAWKAAAQAAERHMFQDKGGEVQQFLVQGRSKLPGGRWIVPFANTPMTLWRVAMRKSMFAPLALANDFRTGADGDMKVRHAAESALAAMVAGGLYALFWGDDDDDEYPRITGSNPPGAPRNKYSREAYTIPPDSIRIGNEYYDYRRIEPFGSAVSGLVTALESYRQAKTSEEASKHALKAFGLFTRNFTEHPMLQGVSDLLDAMESPERRGAQFVQNFAGSFNPNVVKGTARDLDPMVRERSGMDFWEGLRYSAMPTAENAQPKVDVWGQDVEKGGSFAQRTFTPYKNSGVIDRGGATETLNQWIRAWNRQNPDDPYLPTAPGRSITENKVQYTLTPEQWTEYKRRSGQLAVDRLNRMKLDPANPTERERDAVKRTIEFARERARKEMLRELRGTR